MRIKRKDISELKREWRYMLNSLLKDYYGYEYRDYSKLSPQLAKKVIQDFIEFQWKHYKGEMTRKEFEDMIKRVFPDLLKVARLS